MQATCIEQSEFHVFMVCFSLCRDVRLYKAVYTFQKGDVFVHLCSSTELYIKRELCVSTLRRLDAFLLTELSVWLAVGLWGVFGTL